MIASVRPGNEETREIALGLARTIQAVLGRGLTSDAATRSAVWSAAVHVAELLDLPGLAALLATCASHTEAPPRMVTHALERLGRLSDETLERGDLWSFTHADSQLGALAGSIGAQEWSAPGPSAEAPESVQPLADVLADFEHDDPDAVARAQVTLPVAAGLRAALDWLAADMGGGLRVTVQEAALTLAARVAHEPGLAAAGAVLALSGGALLPEPDGRWAIRVPLYTERPAFLLVRQGELSLALPWHAVARLRIADETTRAALAEPSLDPWSALEREGERPIALLARGLSRAWLHLDHVVWRVFADPEPAEASDLVPGGRLVVRNDEGDTYVVVEMSEALRDVPPLPTPASRHRLRRPVLAMPSPSGGEVDSSPSDVAAVMEPPAPETSDSPPGSDDVEEPAGWTPAPAGLRLLGPEDVQPIGVTRPEAGVPAPEAARETPATPVPPTPAAAPGAPGEPTLTKLALVVDDSLVARLSLGRVLEREGWVVEWVEHASEMWEALHASPWGVVFVDVSLPDASGRDHLRALVANRNAAQRRYEVVALTRDVREDRMALESGIERNLRKPFSQIALEELIRELTTPPARA
jgi:CheY-like chemotaxis protein